MNFLKDLLQIQQRETLKQISEKLKLSDFETNEFINKYNKRNYCMIKVSNCKIKEPRVKISDLLSSIDCVHNPSSSG